MTYFQTFRKQFSDAFDMYLSILREVQTRVNAALGRNKGWRLRNACPPCSFKVGYIIIGHFVFMTIEVSCQMSPS
jgi:hypothetical protein